jgi:hypothetical protein
LEPTALALLLAPGAGACGADAATPVLRLEGVRPEAVEGVYLNEELVFHFSAELDPASVTASSVRILPVAPPEALAAGPARGELALTGRSLVFTPDPVLAADLGDGGYRPGTTYAVELAGFPRPEGLRSTDGLPLERSVLYRFTTVDAPAPRGAGGGFLFEDPAPGRGLPVVLRSESVAPGEPIVLEGGEPLDPSTLHAEDFALRRGPRERRALGEPVPLRARLSDNRDRSSGKGTALIELVPMERLEAGETYQLLVDGERLRLRDFGGHPVIVRNARGRAKLELRVEAPRGGPTHAYLETTETFIDERLRSPEAVPGVDGTVHWSDTGRAEVRWPRAAGDGSDGAVLLPPHFLAGDLQATSLALAAGEQCVLSPEPGLVVLRAQGRLELAGALVRRTGAHFPPLAALPFEVEEREQIDSLRPTAEGARGGEALSDWLARARSAELDWTVLIAGGDLVIGGELASDGPLLLAAGGEIRMAAGARLEVPFAATVGRRPSLELRYDEGQRVQSAWRAALALDPPAENPLAAPLRLAVRSAPIPEVGGALRWHPAPRVDGRAGAGGSFRLAYLGTGGSSKREQVVDDPAMLESSPTLRFELHLELPSGGPGVPWDPPWVDSVQVRWDPLDASAARGPGNDAR